MDSPKVILITGSSSGFGRLTAETLARSGHRVFASMRDIAGRNAGTRAELTTLAEKEELALEVVELDVTNEASVDQAIAGIIERAGQIDVLVNNAGVFYRGLEETFTVEQAQKLFDTNFFGVMRMNRAVLPHMRKQGSGLLIYITSVAGQIILPFAGIYSASKFALEALAESYHYNLSGLGINSVIVEPGLFATNLGGSNPEPGDLNRIAGYGAVTDMLAHMTAYLQAFFSNPDSPDPQIVADAVANLVTMPAENRPLRTVVAQEALVENFNMLNKITGQIQHGVMERFGLVGLAS